MCESDLETLGYQIYSVIDADADADAVEAEAPVLLDFLGRKICNNDDLLEGRYEYQQQHCSSSNGEAVDTEAAPSQPTEPGLGGGASSTCTRWAVDVWFAEAAFLNFTMLCTRKVFKEQPTVQPQYRVVDTPFRVCCFCRAALFDPSLLSPQTNTLESFSCESAKAIEFGLCYPGAQDTLKARNEPAHAGDTASPFYLYQCRSAHAQTLKDMSSIPATNHIRERNSFEARLKSGCQTVEVYEEPHQQETARHCIDYARVKQYAHQHLQKAQSAGDGPAHSDIAFLKGLMQWFKCDFFTWVNKPRCSNTSCGAPPGKMDSVGVAQPSAEERDVGWAGRTEVYKCKECQQLTRFPRYNNPAHLMTFRKGRCGEWANAFCLVCRALSLDARWVLDFTDHVWVEVWVASQKRYVHLDPCERSYDAPLGYEKGWGKKLSYVLSFSRHGVVDATARYSRTLSDVIARRHAEMGIEPAIDELIGRFDRMMEEKFQTRTGVHGESAATFDVNSSTLQIDNLDAGYVGFRALGARDIPHGVVLHRKGCLRRELQGLAFLTSYALKPEEMIGRISGDKAWRVGRGEVTEGQADAEDGADGDAHTKAEASKVDYEFKYSDSGSFVRPPWLVPGLLCSSLPGRKRCIDLLLRSEGYSKARGTAVMIPTDRLFPSGDDEASGPGAGAERRPIAMIGNACMTGNARGCYTLQVDRRSGCVQSMSCATDVRTAKACDSDFLAKAVLEFAKGAQGEGEDEGEGEGDVTDPYLHVRDVTLCPVPPADVARGPQLVRIRKVLENAQAAQPPDSETAFGFAAVDGYTCAVPCHILFSQRLATDWDVAGLVREAEIYCDKHTDTLGFAVTAPSAMPTDRAPIALIFGEEGYPLRPAAGCTVYLRTSVPRTIANTGSADVAPSVPYSPPPVVMQYVWLGGGRHGDTAAFDSAALLWKFLDTLSGSMSDSIGGHAGAGASSYEAFRYVWSQCRLTSIDVEAGSNLVNGLRCHYSVRMRLDQDQSNHPIDVKYSSPLFSSSDGEVRRHTLEIPEHDEVGSVTVGAGALVDSVTIKTRGGQVLSKGGSGGQSKTVASHDTFVQYSLLT